MRPILDGRRGFTLLELLVSVAILAIMAGVAYAGLDTVLESGHRVEEENDGWRRLALLYRRIEVDVKSVAPRPAGRHVTEQGIVVGGPMSSGGWQVAFPVAGGCVDETGTPIICRVGYRYREGKLDYLRWPTLDPAPNEEPVAYRALEGVTESSLAFAAGGGWVERWQGSAPSAMRMSLTTPLSGTVEWVWATP